MKLSVPDNTQDGSLKMRVAGRMCETGELATLTIANGKIISITPGIEADSLGGEDVWLSPGFLDVQVNGYAGIDFNLEAWGTSDEVVFDPALLIERLASSGTALLCPTITTNSPDLIAAAFRRIVETLESSPEISRAVPGFHLEGPYLSSEDGPRGAHPKEWIRAPDWNEFQRFQEAAGGRIKICTLAPEVPGAMRFIERLTEAGVAPALGHSGAEPEIIREAVRAGARLSTHLGNGAKAQLPRHPNFIWEQLANDGLYASVIADGFHLPDAVLKVFTRAKGADKIILASDAVALGGLPPGRYAGGRFDVLESGKIVTSGTPYLAGAGALLDSCIPNMLRASGMSLAEVIRSVTSIPAALLGLQASKGKLKIGYDADIALFELHEHDPLKIRLTIRNGKVVYSAA